MNPNEYLEKFFAEMERLVDRRRSDREVLANDVVDRPALGGTGWQAVRIYAKMHTAGCHHQPFRQPWYRKR